MVVVVVIGGFLFLTTFLTPFLVDSRLSPFAFRLSPFAFRNGGRMLIQ